MRNFGISFDRLSTSADTKVTGAISPPAQASVTSIQTDGTVSGAQPLSRPRTGAGVCANSNVIQFGDRHLPKSPNSELFLEDAPLSTSPDDRELAAWLFIALFIGAPFIFLGALYLALCD